MCYSYVMGIDSSILSLKNENFEIQSDGENYTAAFPEDKREIWEEFITAHLDPGYWNEYLTDSGVIFLFGLEDGIRRYEVYDFDNAEVLALCEKLCECKFGSLKQMLTGNHYYKNILSGC